MKTKFNILSEPVRILRRLQQFGYKSAIIAGGAIRDDYTGKEINDFDIFLWDPRLSNEFTDFLHYKKSPMNVESNTFEMERTTEFVDLLQTFDVEVLFQTENYGPLTSDGSKISTPGLGAYITGIWEADLDFNTYQLIYTQLPLSIM